MRTLLCALGLAVALLGASPAHAQFANRSLGLSLGYMDFNRTGGLEGGYFVGFDASYYIESGFDLVSLTKLTFPKDPATGKRVVGMAPSIGIRYLLLEESFRPYAGADISYLFVFKEDQTAQYVGLGPNVGFDYFITDTVSLGVRGQYNFYIALNEKTQSSLTFSVGGAAYF
ncbi:MAG: outer membrane beta-barrel protein [Hyalangium sp.]|uniref:outer membrane beta-barrel protein n=1 Tax=Hyalangium sp. TaxID=2028555 RepID=UPI00389AB9DC